MENLQSITIAGTVNELNNTSLNAFVKGIDGLTLSQAQAALSTRALTDAQKEQILASAGLLQSTQAITLEEVKQMASSMSLSTKKKEEILTTLQGAYAENEWNKERLEAIVASGGEAGAIAESILAKKAENAENVKNIAGRKALTASLKEELSTRLALMASNPAVWIAGIAAVSIGLIALQEKFNKSLDECTEELEKHNSEFKETQSSVESLETELTTCKDRLAELQKLADNGTISIIEQEEYERLQKTNDELERNLRIEKEKAQLSAIEGAKTADETLTKRVQSQYVRGSVESYEGVILEDQILFVFPEDELNAAIEEYQRLQTEIDSLNKAYDNGEISTSDYEKKLGSLTDQQTKARNRASEMSDILVDCEQAYTNLDNTGGSFTTTQTNNYNAVTEANKRYNEFLGTVNGVDESLENLNETEKTLATTTDESDSLIPISKTISDLEDLNKELDNLGTAMANIDAEGKFDLGDLDSIADYFLGLEDVPYDIEAVNNALKSLGDGNASLEEQTDSINTLADQYLKTSGILDTLTQDNAELIKLQLQRMGIVNAEEIVEATLNRTLQDQAQLENILAQYKSIVTGETLTLANVTAQEIQNLIAEGKITNDTANQMAILAIKKQLVNGNTLNTSADINNLISLCQMLGATTTALEKYNQVKNGANGMPQYVIDKYREAAERELKNAINTGEKALKATYTQVPKAIYNGGSNVQKALDDANKAASSSAKETEDTYEELFDFFERRIEVLNDALDLLKSNLENVVGADAKNTLIDAQIGINKESINNYTDALAMYTQKANEALAKIPAEFQSKIVDGSVSMTDFIGSGNEDLVDAINEYKDWAGKISDCKKELADLKQALEDLELDKFNNIVDDFTNQFNIRDNSKDLIDKQIDLFKEASQMIGQGFYKGLINESEGQLAILQQEKAKLVAQMNSALDSGNVEAGSEAWLSMVDSLSEVDSKILDCKKDIEEFNNSIQELHWEVVERIQKNFDGLSDEIKNIIGLIDEVDVSDAEGVWSKEGLTQLGLYAQEYEKAIYAANMYGQEIEQLNQAYIRGEYSATEYSDKLSELKDAQWDEINASESAKDAIMDLNKARIDIMVKAIEEEIDAMKELIDSKKEALDVEQD